MVEEHILLKVRHKCQTLLNSEEGEGTLRRAPRLAQKKREYEVRINARAEKSQRQKRGNHEKQNELCDASGVQGDISLEANEKEHASEEHLGIKAELPERDGSGKAVLLEALAAAERGLEWRWLMGPFLDMQVREEAQHWNEAELMQQLEEAQTELNRIQLDYHALDDMDPRVTLARNRRAIGLMRLGVRTLRLLAGTSTGRKSALVLELAMRPSFDVLCILPAPTASPENAREMICRLHDACAEATEAARLFSCARDSHVAWAWDYLGCTNDQVADTLNDWFGTVHTVRVWRKRRRRGALLLQIPALSYQTVLPLDDSQLTVGTILALMHSDEEVRLYNERLLSRYGPMLGQPRSVIFEQEDNMCLLLRHGYEILRDMASVDEGLVVMLARANGFQPIFDANHDEKNLELDVIHSGLLANLKQSITNALAQHYSEYQVSSMVILRSKEGFLQQPVDPYFTIEGCSSEVDDSDSDFAPLACLVSLESGTVLNVWPQAIESDAQRSYESERVELRRGNIFVFRRDLVHVGVAYENLSHRIHCFLELTEREQAKEEEGQSNSL